MSKEFFIKRGDLLPVIVACLRDANNVPVSLTGGTVKFLMKSVVPNATVKVNATATPHADQGTNPGIVTYTWLGTDTDTAGTFRGEFEVTFTGKKMSFPNDGYIAVQVKEDLA